MKYICNSFFLVIFLMFGLTSTVHAAESRLSFRLVQSKYNVDDILKTGIDIDKTRYEVFAKDNIIYVVSRTVQLDDEDIECDKMLGTPYYSFEVADPSDSNSQVRITFNAVGRGKLNKLTERYIGKGLAVVFDGKLIVAPVISDSLSSGELIVSSLSHEDVRRLIDSIETMCAQDSSFSVRLLHPDQDMTSQVPLSESSVDKSQYECFAKGNVNYWVSKKVELDNSDFEHAKIFVTGLLPSGEPKEMELKAIPWQFSTEGAAESKLPSLRVRITLNKDGRSKLEKLSENNIGRGLAVVLGGRLIMVKSIPGKTTGEFLTVGDLTYVEAKRLRDAINR
jgi:hypothetical protein